MATTKAALLLAVLCLFLVSEIGMLMVEAQVQRPVLRIHLLMEKTQIAGQSVHRGAASHGSRRCAYRHAPHAATPARDVCLQALQLARRCALAMPNTRRAGALEL
ncbi:hypothetical protein V6N11_004127 [Hibiscus sabdariffa]|uniref:Uncharacterized protein n=1 Tax=Hibiscus sabdariffa TaxID=183260 RepID=A0ABR2SFC3_9ROSI